jgi:hypothetical protein
MSISGITATTTSIPTGYNSQACDSSCCNKALNQEQPVKSSESASEKTNELTKEEQLQVREL